MARSEVCGRDGRRASGSACAPATGDRGLRRVRPIRPAARKDLQAHRGTSLVIAGDGQPPAVHALAHAMNQALGNVGKTVVYTEPVEAEPVDQLQSLRDLVADMNAGRVDALVIVGGNPVYTAPADLKLAEAMGKVPLRVHLSLYDDETSALCHWQIPEAHFLEAWSDARGYDGTVSIVQPLIAPLYDGKSAHELLAAMSDRPERSGLRHRARVLETAALTRGLRGSGVQHVLAQVAARRDGGQHGRGGEGGFIPAARRRDRAPTAGSKSSSAPIRRSSMAASPTTAGCRSYRSRYASSRGTTPLMSPSTAQRLGVRNGTG